MIKKILIATDGSGSCNQAIGYAVNLFGTRPDISFHLMNCVSPGHSPLPEPVDNKNSLFPCSDESESKTTAANSCVNQAKERLLRSGIGAGRITTSLVASSNISSAIQCEGEHLLVDSILIARRGIGFVGEMLLGSVSADLLRKCHHTPLWIVDGEVHFKDILVAVDGSCHSLMAVDHLAHMLSGRSDIRVYLHHSLRFFESKTKYDRKQFSPKWDDDWCETYLSGERAVFDGPCQLLRESGLPEDMVTILPETTHIDPSGGIISQARKHKCGTIVMGRRRSGISRSIWGEMATRTIKNTQNMALWVVG